METVSIDTFVPKLRQLVNVSLPMLMHEALIQSAQEFCRQSEFVVYDRNIEVINEGDVIAVVGSSDLNTDGSSYQSCRVERVYCGSTESPIRLEPGTHYKAISRDVLMFNGSCEDVTLNCVIEPTSSTSTLPKSLLDEYSQAVCFGAAYNLMMQPDSDWHNPGLAQEYRRFFIEAIREAKRFRLESGSSHAFSNPTRKREFF